MKKKSTETSPKEAASVHGTDQFLELVKKNKSMIIVALIGIVLIFSITMFYVNYSQDQENLGWSRFVQAMAETEDPGALKEAMEKIAGSSAEPWALYLLSVKEFRGGNLTSARDSFDKLESSFPDHYLFKNPQLAQTFKEKLVAEQTWTAQHSLSEEAPAPEENAATEEEGNDEDAQSGEDTSPDISEDPKK